MLRALHTDDDQQQSDTDYQQSPRVHSTEAVTVASLAT